MSKTTWNDLINVSFPVIVSFQLSSVLICWMYSWSFLSVCVFKKNAPQYLIYMTCMHLCCLTCTYTLIRSISQVLVFYHWYINCCFNLHVQCISWIWFSDEMKIIVFFVLFFLLTFVFCSLWYIISGIVGSCPCCFPADSKLLTWSC